MTLRIDITGLPAEQVSFAASPLAELTSMLHVLAAPDHHPQLTAWAAGVRTELRPELAERLQEAEFLWRSSRAEFLLPARPRKTLAEELDDIDRIPDEAYVTSALVTTCGSNRVRFGGASPLTDADARDRALDQAQARGALQEAFAGRLLADPRAVPQLAHHQRAGVRLGSDGPGGLPSPRGPASRRTAHHRAARPPRALLRGPAGADGAGPGPAGGDAEVAARGCLIRRQCSGLPHQTTR